jgi:hypothetical protein
MHKSVLDDLVAAALHAAKFGSLARLLISEDSKASEAAAPEFYSGLMAKLSSLSDNHESPPISHLNKVSLKSAAAQAVQP